MAVVLFRRQNGSASAKNMNKPEKLDFILGLTIDERAEFGSFRPQDLR
jgi:hypothetical protein